LRTLPAIKLTKLAKRFKCRVWISLEGQWPWTDAKAIELVMAMKQPRMTALHFMAEGDDAVEAVDALARLVESDFRDDDDER
jgi:phosphotransferase system HPr (HPr) family protein